MKTKIEQFIKESNEVLLSLDEDRIRTLYARYGVELPPGLVFWGAVHKAITGRASLPLQFRKQSKRWLNAHGLKPLDDGELE